MWPSLQCINLLHRILPHAHNDSSDNLNESLCGTGIVDDTFGVVIGLPGVHPHLARIGELEPFGVKFLVRTGLKVPHSRLLLLLSAKLAKGLGNMRVLHLRGRRDSVDDIELHRKHV